MNLLLFEEGRVGDLEPVTTARPAWQIGCAGWSLLEMAGRLAGGGGTRATVRSWLRDLVAADHPGMLEPPDPSDPWTLCVNARMAPTPGNLARLCEWTTRKVPVHCNRDGALVAAVVPTRAVAEGTRDANGFFQPAIPDASEPVDEPFDLFRYLHDIVRLHESSLPAILELRLNDGGWHEISDGVFSEEPGCRLPPQLAVDTTAGPVLLSAGCRLGAFVVLTGPLLLGRDNRIAPHAAVGPFVSTGPVCKIGGEIHTVVLEGWTNKQHHGFLGHSWLGSWINLGAGTCNSDLKNTYGIVSMEYPEGKVSTGMQFVGCFIGDFAKTAINSSIFTGKRIGVCSMLYGTAATDVPAFTNYARSLGKVSTIDPQVAAETQRRMFARRDRVQRPCDAALLHTLFQRTEESRAGLPTGTLAW